MIALHESTGSYAVDALEGDERSEFEAHLPTCAACQSEVAEFAAVTAELAVLSLAEPPVALRGNTLAALPDTPQLPAADRRRASPPPRPRRARLDTEPARENGQAPVGEVAARRQGGRNRILAGLVAALLALVVGLGGVVYTLVQQRQDQVAQTTFEQQLYSAPDAVLTTAALPGGGQATFIASRQLNRALFLGTDLPDPGSNRYQLWTATGTDLENLTGVVRDVQVTETGPGIKVFFAGDVARADFLAVNLEPAGTTPAAPTNPVLGAGPTTS